MLVEELQICDGQKLIDYDNIKHDHVEYTHVDHISFLIHLGKVKDAQDAYLMADIYK